MPSVLQRPARSSGADALRESEARFRALSEHALVGIYIIQDERFTYVNPALANGLGFQPAEMIGADPLAVIDPEDRALVAENMRRRMAGEVVENRYELRGRTKNGETKYLELFSVRTVLNGRPAIIGNILDITERRRAEQAIRSSLEGTIGAIAATIESRDPYTAGHQRRVAQLGVATAREMGLPEATIEGLRFGALIHDLGKIQVPAELLARPTQLSPPELALIRIHPEVGYSIVKEIDFPWPVAAMIRQHHERLDGSGYPQGLGAADIVLEARILAVADTVEAMASHRPYRPSLGIDAALGEIVRNSERLYDPKIVGACLRLFREKGFAFRA
jgi:PAS domain S-box-containing protein/putative nucleotidyltransferase with HDIG domain